MKAAKKDFILLDSHANPMNQETHEIKWKIYQKTFLTDDVIELHMRSYSIASYTDNILTFFIKLKEGGIAGEYLRNLEEWTNINLLWPFGDFVIQNTSNKKIFIATGTGLSPIFYMMHHAWNTEKVLYFWVRIWEDVFYLWEITEYSKFTGTHISLARRERMMQVWKNTV